MVTNPTNLLMSILSKDKIKTIIVPFFPVKKQGRPIPESVLIGIISCILYRLKTGCQWRELPVNQYFEPNNLRGWNTVYKHFNRWSSEGLFRRMWIILLHEYRTELDLSSMQLDGSQTRAHRGGEFVSYQKRRADETTNFLFLSDKKGNIVGISEPISGNHHDLFEIQTHFDQALSFLQEAHIQVNGLFMNADAGFDFGDFRTHCFRWDIMPNIDLNPRKGTKSDREEYFDPILYLDRKVIEHAFAWQDAFKGLLIRYEVLAQNWLSMNILGIICRFILRIDKKLNKT